MEIPVGLCLPGPTAPSTDGYSRRRAPEMQGDGGVSSDPPQQQPDMAVLEV